MKQVFQDVRRGDVRVEEVPPPTLRPGTVLVRTSASVVSAGTERLALEFGQKSLLGKALERPDLVRQVWDKARRDGVVSAYQAVMGRLVTPLSLGYSSAGFIEAVGEGVEGLRVGDRVACAGAGYASHAESVVVPKNLCVPVSREVSLEDAAFATIGAVALQGLRLAEPTLGESVVVIGLGLIGQILVQCLKANGCRVFGIDRDRKRVALAQELGADEALISTGPSLTDRIHTFSQGRGADAVLIAAATESSGPVELAGEICRDRGRVIVVGAVKIDVPRRKYYERELSLQVSRSYGPGRYDSAYEEGGHDYPIGYVRWTENRNMEAFLELLEQQKVNVSRLITHRFPIWEGEKAYGLLSGRGGKEFLGIVLTYSDNPDLNRKLSLVPAAQGLLARPDRVTLGLIGAGNFARSTLLPVLKKLSSISLKGVATSSGVNAKSAGVAYGFDYCTSDYHDILKDEGINTVIIATRHSLHGPIVVEALRAGKHVFVEKPLCVNEDQLGEILRLLNSKNGDNVANAQPGSRPPVLMVGFNRRFAAYAIKAREFFAGRKGPLIVNYRVNAGALPADHWIHNPEEGGRIIGEICHFVDFISFLLRDHPLKVFAQGVSPDTVSVTLKYQDGSIGTIHYLASGHRNFPKERVEIFADGQVFVIDDFRKAEWVSNTGRGRLRSWIGQDKGHGGEIEAFIKAILEGATSPIEPNDAVQTTRVTFKIVESLAIEKPVEVW